MENKEKMKIAVAAACLAATITVIVATLYRKPRKNKQHLTDSDSFSCYLKTKHKPQHSFKRVLADNSYSPFRHLNLNSSSQTTDNNFNLHPYKSEITQLMKNSKIQLMSNVEGKMIPEMKDSYVWVDTEFKLKELADVLSKECVFAVDTEQHSLHSFLGFTALIQISTQSEDYLVDTIALHDVLPILRPVFANSSICKVFHGADNDVLWLQKDFHIYVVNLFDTAKGCEVLSKPQKSLAYLLETYCGVATDKSLQREDWRQRPLPTEMVHYARTDSHYLLYIAKCLASELIEQDKSCLNDKFHFVVEANRRSNATCLQLFVKDIESCPGESAASSIINRHFNDRGSASSITCHAKFQDFVRQLCTWRDLMARMHDESLKYVLSDQAIVALAADAPTSERDIYDCILQADMSFDSLNVLSTVDSPSAVVCSHIEDLAYIFNNDAGKNEDIFNLILQKHLGPNGSCPLSVYNYTLLSKRSLKLTNQLVSKGNTYNHSKKVSRMASRELFVQKFSCKSPAYHNCRIYANDGRLLCYCDRRKLEWYLRRDLAKLVDDDPLAIMLLFEPKGGPEDDDNDFYVQSKKNICVGCGEENHYLRYRVIPSCYRVHFPEHLKSHRSHDIVLVCVDCHEIAHSAAEKYKRIVAAEFGIPLFLQKVVDPSQAQEKLGLSASSAHLEDAGVSPLELRTAAMALLRHGHRMPSKRHEELTQIVMKYYGGRTISQEDLERALEVGMSPHERRRAAKKRGLSFKHAVTGSEPDITGNGTSSAPENNFDANKEEDDGDKGSSTPGDFLDPNLVDSTHAVNRGADSNSGGNSPTYFTPMVYAEGSITDGMSTNSDKVISRTCLESEATIVDADGRSECNGTLNGTTSESNGTSRTCLESEATKVDAGVDSECYGTLNGTASEFNGTLTGTLSSKSASKMSLLGHGPHGNQVVNHLLKEYGDDGVQEFCQRWRQVFVDAIKPRFLPAGWDVTHSGRRDFGEFSVYNPAKKGSAPVTSHEHI
ncbi:protein RRP6-like 3 isoform X1 [Daucus carota subsp. sativus]|uniref:protein RRP6-like 3 isoform X1 n=2 Tax=Daucus carota subsp. sativus TaxID=79200 RepID=UPI0007EF0C93|nr:PREDICTED: protein RRP6-like 3 [Daucus carota subsp. sativus]XP_017253587.1 PREDICTED: protein RRP6-like 3 [Daucus carota subsp. sativus]XP_017253588.1 PREDICTED: protein RRP6-like 3 [Daucus carota subsp. sativus]XP_017253589.1 PREDICTED: protein RRP6-like 3 [Daucus carota subsp. sativus]